MRDPAPGRIARVRSSTIVPLLIVCGSASAATLTLNDGSVIQGDITTLQNDVYTIETDSLGTVPVRKQEVRSIDHSDDSRQSSPARLRSSESPPDRADVQALQSRMMRSAACLLR